MHTKSKLIFFLFSLVLCSRHIASGEGVCQNTGDDIDTGFVDDLLQMAMPGTSSTTFFNYIKAIYGFNPSYGSWSEVIPLNKTQPWLGDTGISPQGQASCQVTSLTEQCQAEDEMFLCHGNTRYVLPKYHADLSGVLKAYENRITLPGHYHIRKSYILTFVREPLDYYLKMFHSKV